MLRTEIQLDASALHHNYLRLSQLIQPCQLVPVVKANAYGHGLAEIYQLLAPLQPPVLSVNYLDEAVALREMGFAGRLVVVGPCPGYGLADAHGLHIELTVGDEPSLAAWHALSKRPGIHLKFDTGMGRQGFAPHAAPKLVNLMGAARPLIRGISSHFANVEDVLEQSYAEQQLQAFQVALQNFPRHEGVYAAHIASSASALILPTSHFDWARVGISLYGLWPSNATKLSYLQVHQNSFELRPVLSWKTELSTIKAVPKDSFIGYGCTYRAVQDLTVAVLPIGYFEGYPRVASNHGAYVLVRGRRCPVLGRICMNMMTIDVSHVPGAVPGDPVTLIGTDGSETLEAQTVAAWAETIHYELLARLNPQIPKIVKAQHPI